ncbi:hypothetical protein C8N42_104181 [Celeribacter persicus]|uniref:Uncharacterized protein n=1 Tax=Celeribacter persicus TaxID=1651082 RepID=A0A2T5HSL1_9RHOB|nr:hypothetical protein C8N42_104181 [Celeribacter persicus]
MKHVLLALSLITPWSAFADGPARTPPPIDLWQSLLTSQRQTAPQIYEAACCKVCRKGYACGNSCISRDKACHQPPGCACNG